MRVESVYSYGIHALAEKMGASTGYVYQIAQGHRKVSPLRARAIERATEGRVKASDLRPDVFGPEST